MKWDSILAFMAGVLTCLAIVSIGIAFGYNLSLGSVAS